MSHKRPHPSPRQPYPKQPSHKQTNKPHQRRQQHFTQAVWDETERLFSKKFTFKKPEDDSWQLPPCELFFSKKNEAFPELSQMKEELNRVKGLLSDKEIRSWHEHTNRTNRAGKVISHLKQTIHPQLCTQAWCKFHEVVSTFPIVSDTAINSGVFSSVHLCEAPGAFITSLNHYLANWRVDCEWNWVGNSLNPYFEGNNPEHTIDDDRFIFGTLSNWHFGADNTGDIMSAENLQHLKAFVADIQPVHLVTADGSIDCQKNPGEQETIVSQLHYCEVISVLQLLGEGGVLVVKKFTMLEPASACLMYLLNCVFEEVHVFKPATSKSGNSEVYVICVGYCGQESLAGHMDKLMNNFKPESLENDLFPCEALPATFTSQLVSCSSFFIKLQCETIQENLRLFDSMSEEEVEHIRQARDCCAQEYVHRYQLRPIRKDDRIPTEAAARPHFTFDLRKQLQGSFNERQQQARLPWAQKVLQKEEGDRVYVQVASDAHNTAITTLEETEESLVAVEDVLYTVMGRGLERIYNSRFCDIQVLNQWNEALDKAQILHPENADFLRKLQGDVKSGDNKTFLTLHGHQLSQSLMPKVLCLTNTCVLKMIKPFLSGGLEPKIFSIDSGPVETFLALKEVSPGEDVLPCAPEDRTGVLQDSRLPKLLQMTGVDTIVADVRTDSGEFGQEEQKTKEDFLLLCLLAFKSLPQRGSLVCCVHTVLTRLSAGLVYILHRLFTKLSLCPLQSDSRPSQLLVCTGYRGCSPTILEALQEVRQSMCELQGDRDVLELVPMQQLLSDERFQQFLKAANEAVLHTSLATVVTWEKQLLQNFSTPCD